MVGVQLEFRESIISGWIDGPDLPWMTSSSEKNDVHHCKGTSLGLDSY
jgi:hypothetical protein